jgi:hypothetical protein
LARLYASPFAHCPSLCPYDPPPALFSDDYDPLREGSVWAHCLTHCPLAGGEKPPCLRRYHGIWAP